MERREPDYEDEHIRQWRARPEDPVDRDDPTMLGIDGKHEELFESRIYQIRREYLAAIVLEAADDDLDLVTAALLLTAADDATFRMLAKRNKDDSRLTFIVVGSLAGLRTLLGGEDRVEEERYREFVRTFEEDAFSRGLASPAAVITLEQWREYTAREPGPNGSA